MRYSLLKMANLKIIMLAVVSIVAPSKLAADIQNIQVALIRQATVKVYDDIDRGVSDAVARASQHVQVNPEFVENLTGKIKAIVLPIIAEAIRTGRSVEQAVAAGNAAGFAQLRILLTQPPASSTATEAFDTGRTALAEAATQSARDEIIADAIKPLTK